MGESGSETSYWSQDASALPWAVGASHTSPSCRTAYDVGLASLSTDCHISGDPTHGWSDWA